MPPTPATGPSKIPIPLSLSASTPSLPPASQAALIQHLRETQSLSSLSSLLTDSLARSGWTDRVRALSLELLRNGTCDTFPELMSEVLRRAKIPKASMSNGATTGPVSAQGEGARTNGTNTPTPSQNGAGAAGGGGGGAIAGNGAITVSKEWSGGPDGLPDVRIPEGTVEVGVEFLKEKIRDCVEVVDDDDL